MQSLSPGRSNASITHDIHVIPGWLVLAALVVLVVDGFPTVPTYPLLREPMVRKLLPDKTASFTPINDNLIESFFF